jgi:hypothetical protein
MFRRFTRATRNEKLNECLEPGRAFTSLTEMDTHGNYSESCVSAFPSRAASRVSIFERSVLLPHLGAPLLINTRLEKACILL